MEEIQLKIDKELDLLTAFVSNPELNKSPLEVREIDGNILFHINPETNELVMIQIYDFSIVRRQLTRHRMILLTKESIKTWLNTLVESFRANNKTPRERFA